MNIILGTGSYDTVKYGNMVSVTGDGGAAWDFYGQSYKKLAPRLITYTPYINELNELKKIKNEISINFYNDYLNHIIDLYIKSYYETRLKDLDVYELLDILYKKFGENIILLCHENINEFCHRRLIADYIKIKTGIYIPEIKVLKEGIILEETAINYEDKLKKLM